MNEQLFFFPPCKCISSFRCFFFRFLQMFLQSGLHFYVFNLVWPLYSGVLVPPALPSTSGSGSLALSLLVTVEVALPVLMERLHEP